MSNKKIKTAFIGDECEIIVPNKTIDCSELGFFDDLEYECWELVEKYLEYLGIEMIEEDTDERISFDVAKEIQDYILDRILEAGVKIQFSNKEQ